MSTTVAVILIAWMVLCGFLLAAALVWTIRTRRNEGNFVPAPDRNKKRKWKNPDSPGKPVEIPEWLRGTAEETPNPIYGTDRVPEWLQGINTESPDFNSDSAKIPTGAGPRSPFGDFLRNAVPQLSAVIDLGKLVTQMQAAGEFSNAPDERNAALREALDRMLEQQPNNEILLQLRDSLPAGEESESDGEITVDVEVVNVAGRNIVRVDGVDYYSLAEIPDPEVRDQARQLLLELDDQEFS